MRREADVCHLFSSLPLGAAPSIINVIVLVKKAIFKGVINIKKKIVVNA